MLITKTRMDHEDHERFWAKRTSFVSFVAS